MTSRPHGLTASRTSWSPLGGPRLAGRLRLASLPPALASAAEPQGPPDGSVRRVVVLGEGRGALLLVDSARTLVTGRRAAQDPLPAGHVVAHGEGMKLLVLGGTVFLSRAVAADAVARGHEVVCACRGESGTVPAGARLVRWDRGAGDPVPVDEIGPGVDVVVDVARLPSWVRAGVAAYPEAHWVFVSTINVYADDATPGGPSATPLHAAVHSDEDPATSPEAYGPMKVACEEVVTAGSASAMLVRPGLICGPGDPTSRFGYWPERLAEAVHDAGEVLAGGDPADLVQVIDVRDLAAWIVTAAEARTTGAYDGTGTATPVGELLAGVAAGVGSDATLTWVPGAFLAEHDVEPWSGPQGLPLWLPRPGYDGMMQRDVSASLATGLTTRPVADTARDTLAWLLEHPEVPRTGLSREHERAVLDAWHAR